MMILIGYEVNENRSKVRDKEDWMVFLSDWKHLHQRLLAIGNQLIVSPVIPVFTLKKKRKIKTVPVLTRLPCSAFDVD